MMKQIKLIFLAICFLLISGCKKDIPDLSGLLKTVPSSAAAVAGINIRGIIEDLGCKVDGNVIKPGQEVKQLMENLKESDKTDLLALFNGDSGIVPECGVVFVDANRTFLTLSIYDTQKFKATITEGDNKEFVDQGNGVEICDNIAVKGNQAWICLSSKPIDPEGIAAYATLSQSQSFLNTDMSRPLLEADWDITGWGNFKTGMSVLLDRSDLSMATLATGFLFDGVESIVFTADFKKGEMESEIILLNGKGRPAKYLLPAEKIDVNTLKMLGDGRCSVLFGFTMTPKLVKKLEKVSSALGAGVFGDLNDLLENVDGTVGVALNDEYSINKGIITTKGKVSSDLSSLLSMFANNISQEDNYLLFSQGTAGGAIPINDIAEELEDYTIGLVADLQGLTSVAKVPEGFSNIIVGLEPESGSLKLEFKLKTADKKENFLLTALKSTL